MMLRAAASLGLVALVLVGCDSDPEEDVRPLGPVATHPEHDGCGALMDDAPLPSPTVAEGELDDLEADLSEAATALGEELGISGERGGVHGVGVTRDRDGFLLMVVATRVDSSMPTEFRGHRVRYCRAGPFVAH